MLLNFEFLHVIRGGNVNDPAPSPNGIPRAVQQEGSRAKVAPAEIEERDILVGGTLCAASLNELPLRIAHGRVQLHKIKYVSKIERHLRYHLCRDFCSEIGIIRLKERRLRRYLDLSL